MKNAGCISRIYFGGDDAGQEGCRPYIFGWLPMIFRWRLPPGTAYFNAISPIHFTIADALGDAFTAKSTGLDVFPYDISFPLPAFFDTRVQLYAR